MVNHWLAQVKPFCTLALNIQQQSSSRNWNQGFFHTCSKKCNFYLKSHLSQCVRPWLSLLTFVHLHVFDMSNIHTCVRHCFPIVVLIQHMCSLIEPLDTTPLTTHCILLFKSIFGSIVWSSMMILAHCDRHYPPPPPPPPSSSSISSENGNCLSSSSSSGNGGGGIRSESESGDSTHSSHSSTAGSSASSFAYSLTYALLTQGSGLTSLPPPPSLPVRLPLPSGINCNSKLCLMLHVLHVVCPSVSICSILRI